MARVQGKMALTPYGQKKKMIKILLDDNLETIFKYVKPSIHSSYFQEFEGKNGQYIKMVIASLFIMVKNWNQFKQITLGTG